MPFEWISRERERERERKKTRELMVVETTHQLHHTCDKNVELGVEVSMLAVGEMIWRARADASSQNPAQRLSGFDFCPYCGEDLEQALAAAGPAPEATPPRVLP